MAPRKMHSPDPDLQELLLPAHETALGGEQGYTAAVACVKNTVLEKEGDESLEQTKNPSGDYATCSPHSGSTPLPAHRGVRSSHITACRSARR